MQWVLKPTELAFRPKPRNKNEKSYDLDGFTRDEAKPQLGPHKSTTVTHTPKYFYPPDCVSEYPSSEGNQNLVKMTE
jgi:hypothetical protein